MRTEREMMDLILGEAERNERIRAVAMNGSRANPAAPRDPFQDYDIVYFMEDPAPFVRNREWIARFGELMILQTPDDMNESTGAGDARGAVEPEPRACYGYLMQFMDGNRIDLTVAPFSMIEEIVSDSQTIVLLDKDGRIPPVPPASDRDYRAKRPSAKLFADRCNEFWWLAPYVAKGLWRREILNALAFLELQRAELMRMAEWAVGKRTGGGVSIGKHGKYLERYLEPAEWRAFLASYPAAEYEAVWEALFSACGLFRSLAHEVASTYGYDYPAGDDARVSAHLRRVRALPPDAAEIS